jgi:benzoyl-CoA 2,3-dioxygenase component B
MFTYFTDRDGKMQLESLAQSGFDPLSRTCRFMLTEEAHHMFVGESGVGRVVQRTCEAMNEAGITDPNEIEAVRALGVIDLPTLQKKINFHLSVTCDLFGAEVSTNGATAFIAGIKGRYNETKLEDDHQLDNDTYLVSRVVDGKVVEVEETAHNAINARLLDDYHKDAAGGVGRWNKIIKKAGIDFSFVMPFKGFARKVGVFADDFISPDGQVLTEQEWNAKHDDWFCSEADGDYIQSLMKPCREAGEYAGWIAAPRIGIDSKPVDYEYVKIN